jgi:hypothetical protein
MKYIIYLEDDTMYFGTSVKQVKEMAKNDGYEKKEIKFIGAIIQKEGDEDCLPCSK